MTTPTYKYTVGYVNGTFESSDGCSLEYVVRVLDDIATSQTRTHTKYIKTFLIERERALR